MAHLTAAAHRLLAEHHGIASATQLIESGMTRHAIGRLVREGGLETVLQGAFRTPSRPLDETARCAAVCAAHPDLTIAGPTAARLWGFRRVPNDRRIHVLAPPASNPTVAPWVVPYRTAAVHERDIIQRSDGIRLTSRPRTTLDLARTLGARDLRSVIEQAMHDGHHGQDEMLAVAVDWLSPRRAWVRRFVQQVEGRGAGGAAESHPEVVLARELERVGVPGLVRQHEIDLPGYGRARFDLAIPPIRWAIEVDVHPTHRESEGMTRDELRDAAAANVGWLVSRVPDAGFGAALPETVRRLGLVHATRERSFHER